MRCNNCKAPVFWLIMNAAYGTVISPSRKMNRLNFQMVNMGVNCTGRPYKKHSEKKKNVIQFR